MSAAVDAVPRRHLLQLPPELISTIALLLDFRGIVALASTCRQLRDIYAASKAQQHVVELGADGLLPASPSTSTLPLAAQHAHLLARRAAWTALRPSHHSQTSAVDSWLAFDLSGGVYAHYTPARAPQLVLHRLPTRAAPAHTTEVETLDIRVKDLALDPAQGLLALLEGHRPPVGAPFEDEPVGTDATGALRVHLRALFAPALDAPHDRAAHPILYSACAQPHADTAELFLARTSLAVFVGADAPALRVWDWPSSALLLSLDAPDFAAASLRAASFVFLSPRASALAGRSEDGDAAAVHLVRLDSARATLATLDGAVVLSLPAPRADRSVAYVLARTGSFGLPARELAMHVPDPAARVHVFLVQVMRAELEEDENEEMQVPDAAVMIVVKTDVLLRYLEGPSREIGWAGWGPGQTRIVEHGEADGLSERAVFGARVVFSTQYPSGAHASAPAPWTHYLLDFNVRRPPPDSDAMSDNSLADARALIGRSQSAGALGLREGAVGGAGLVYMWTAERMAGVQLACVCTRLSAGAFGIGDDVLLDHEHIVKRRTFPDSELEQTAIYSF